MTILDDSGKALVLGNVYDPEELSLKINDIFKLIEKIADKEGKQI